MAKVILDNNTIYYRAKSCLTTVISFVDELGVRKEKQRSDNCAKDYNYLSLQLLDILERLAELEGKNIPKECK